MLDKIREKYKEKQDEKLQYEFLPSALEIVENPPSPLGTKIITGIFLIILTAIIYASISKVDMVAVARGKIIPNGRVKVIQVLEEGIITGIYVDEGEKVNKGQLLIDLDKTLKQVDEQTINNNLNILKAENIILQDYLDKKDIRQIQEKIQNFDLDEDIKTSLNKLILSKRENFDTQKSFLNLTIEESKNSIDLAKEQLNKLELENNILNKDKENIQDIQNNTTVEENELETLKNKIQIAINDEQTYKNLYEEGAVSKQEYMDKLNTLNLLKKQEDTQKAKMKNEKTNIDIKYKQTNDNIELNKNQINQQKIQIEKLEIQLNQSQEKLNNLKKEDLSQTLNQILEKQKQIKEQESLRDKTKQSLNYQSIKSPVNGTVSSLAVNTIGGVVSPSQSIMSIVPENTELIIEAMVQNKDIGFIHENQEVNIKIDTFSFQKYGVISGKVEKISPDAYEDEKYGLVYKIKVKLNKDTIKVEDKDVKLSSGMGVTVEIKTGKRRVIEFLIEPLVKYIDEAFKIR
ncbi:MAG: HlyD family type I secretion periplasmic adaptor subunit [Peptoanaerobacter stomatis]|uniref:HlyD family type I secretion periplasmic adaptor subunit n=1 Tax=Peptoanaerobacter stomatis TaxID=796937 RepID=UPI003FA19714